MKNTFILFGLTFLAMQIFAQSHTITFSTGKEIYCSITQINDKRVIYTYMQDSALHTDSADITSIQSIAFNAHSKAYDESYYDEMFGTSESLLLAEANKKYEPAQNRIAWKVTKYKGTVLSIAGASCLVTGAILVGAGTALFYKAQIYYTMGYGYLGPGYLYPTSLTFLTVGSVLATTGIVTWPIGAHRLKQAKNFKNQGGKYVPMLSFHPSVITNQQFAITPAYGSGINLTF